MSLLPAMRLANPGASKRCQAFNAIPTLENSNENDFRDPIGVQSGVGSVWTRVRSRVIPQLCETAAFGQTVVCKPCPI